MALPIMRPLAALVVNYSLKAPLTPADVDCFNSTVTRLTFLFGHPRNGPTLSAVRFLLDFLAAATHVLTVFLRVGRNSLPPVFPPHLWF